MSRTSSRLIPLAALAAACFALAACSSDADPQTSTPASTAPGTSTSGSTTASTVAPTTAATTTATTDAPSTSAPRSGVQRVFDSMTERQRVGQLLMVDCPSTGITDATRTAITDHDVGAVILDGTTHAGLSAIQGVTARLRQLSSSRARLFIATDQEGGNVQRLQGLGFDDIPSAVVQGASSPRTLQGDASTWGGQLLRAGVNVDLAPVLDTVPPGSAPNPPIGDLSREYGRTPAEVESHGLAVVRGLLAAGVDPTVKHFPGLGRVAGNTDVTGGVTDRVTTRDDPYLAPFRAAIAAKVPFVMMSTAIYSRIDAAHPAAFSSIIITGLLRGALGFHGVVISDDLGAAAQVSAFSVGQRAVLFVDAGGDMILTVNASQAAAMTDALLDRARSDPAFARKVDGAVLRVLAAKQARGLL